VGEREHIVSGRTAAVIEQPGLRALRIVLSVVIATAVLGTTFHLLVGVEALAPGAVPQLFVAVWWRFPAFSHLVVAVALPITVGAVVILRRPFYQVSAAVAAVIFVVASLASLYVLHRVFATWLLGARPSF